MSTLRIEWLWRLDGPLHAGSGLSRGGYADRLIRMDATGHPFLAGDAVKGAIRMSAERLLRWLVAEALPELEDKSLPRHPVLSRIFNPVDSGVYYRFRPGRWVIGQTENGRASLPTNPFTISSTALDPDSRVARTETLRTIEASSRADHWEMSVEAEGGDWKVRESNDWKDCRFLCAAILAVDAIGGKRGSGYGQVSIDGAPACSATGMSVEDLKDSKIIAEIRGHLLAELERVKADANLRA